MICFHHFDQDGRLSAFWIKFFYKEENITFIEMDYDKKFPIEKVSPNETVWIVDFSIPVEDMKNLMKITKDIHWIDHHKTAIEEYSKEIKKEIKGIRFNGLSGCVLTYEYLCSMLNKKELIKRYTNNIVDIYVPEIKENFTVPYFTALVNDWDLASKKYEDTNYFILGANSKDTNPSLDDISNFWYSCLLEDYNIITTIEDGKVIKQFKDRCVFDFIQTFGYETLFENYKCFAVNLCNCNSDYFEKLLTIYDVCISYIHRNNSWKISLYSNKVDVGEVALKYGGGGHKKAAGFFSSKLPFN